MLPVLQLALATLVILRYRRTRTVTIHTSITTGFIVIMTVTMFRGTFDIAVFLIADAVVHVVLPACWLIIVAGIFAVPLMLKRRLFVPLKFWLLMTATLLTAEPAVRFLERPQTVVLDLPEDFPNAPRDEIHIAAIGGSSTLGHPYQPKYGFPQVIAWRLQQLYPDKKVVLHNLAKGGLNLRQATHELNRLTVRPHLLLVYSGHNEFYHDLKEFNKSKPSRLPFVDPWMRWSALFRMSDNWVSRKRAMREFRRGRRFLVDRPIALPKLYQQRLDRFRNQCEQFSAYCRRQRITTIWFVPAASESGFEPNRSGNSDRLTSAQQADLNRIGRTARSTDTVSAVEQYREVLLRIPDFAEFHFRLAECLRKTGDLAGARHHFIEALNRDGHPIRANRDYREAIRQTARALNTPLVETVTLLRPHADDRILGKTLFHDNVHMTLKGYYLAGLAGCDVIIRSGVLAKTFGPPRNVKPLTLADAIEMSGLDREDLVRAYRQTAFGFSEMERWRYDGTTRHQQSLRFQELADALANQRIAPGENGTESLKPD